MIADSSSCAVLGLLLRVLFSPDIILGGRDLAERLSRTALECFVSSSASTDLSLLKANPGSVTLFYAMAGDKSGSYFLEAVVECCSIPLLLELLHGALQGSAKEYAMDGAGNFVLQAVLRRLSAELEREDTSEPELKALRAVTDVLLAELTADDLFAELVLTKGGVVLWMLEVARWTGIQTCNTDWAEIVGAGLISFWTNKGVKDLSTVLAERLAPKAALEAAAESKMPPKKVNGRVVVDKDSAQLLIARLIGALLKLNKADIPATGDSRAAVLVAQAVHLIPLETLKHVATSGPLSRAVLDTVLDQCEGNEGSQDANVLTSSLSALSVELADHFIGQHVLKRAFDKGSAADKEAIVTLLDAAKEQLGKTKEGRNSLRIVQAELFARKPEEWRALLRKQGAALEMLKEIETTGAKYVTHPSSSGSGGEMRIGGFDKRGHDDDQRNGGNNVAAAGAPEEEEGAAGTGNRKRKRKRPGKKNADDNVDVEVAPVKNIPKPEQPVKVEKHVSIEQKQSVPAKMPIQTPGERNIDMKKIQKLRSGKVTSLAALGDEIESMAKISKNK